MSEYEKVREIFRNSNELIRASDITKHGIDNRADYQWAEDGELGDVEIITRFFPEAVFCMGSALHYYGYVDRTPDRCVVV